MDRVIYVKEWMGRRGRRKGEKLWKRGMEKKDKGKNMIDGVILTNRARQTNKQTNKPTHSPPTHPFAQ